jgi:hypothetical protein
MNKKRLLKSIIKNLCLISDSLHLKKPNIKKFYEFNVN